MRQKQESKNNDKKKRRETDCIAFSLLIAECSLARNGKQRKSFYYSLQHQPCPCTKKTPSFIFVFSACDSLRIKKRNKN